MESSLYSHDEIFFTIIDDNNGTKDVTVYFNYYGNETYDGVIRLTSVTNSLYTVADSITVEQGLNTKTLIDVLVGEYTLGIVRNNIDTFNTEYTFNNDIITVSQTTTDPPDVDPGVTDPPPCFPPGENVHTDQGLILIEKLIPGEHTIHGNKIVDVTYKTSPNARLVLLPMGIISENVPNKDTLITTTHLVLYNGQMRPASDIPGKKYHPYVGEPLYNVLMEKYDMMKVNNMTVETLHPKNRSVNRKLIKCKREACAYSINSDKNNNNGQFCCNLCKSHGTHGQFCERLTVKKKCKRKNCAYFVDPEENTNNGNYCCNLCKSHNTHGPLCKRVTDKKKCKNQNCNFYTHSDTSNGYGNYCCNKCKSHNTHGRLCERNEIEKNVNDNPFNVNSETFNSDAEDIHI